MQMISPQRRLLQWPQQLAASLVVNSSSSQCSHRNPSVAVTNRSCSWLRHYYLNGDGDGDGGRKCSSITFGNGDAVPRQYLSSITGTQRDGRQKDRRAQKFGHDYARIGRPVDPSICALSEDEIRGLIRDRIRSRRARDFVEADSILKRLEECGIDVDDKSKQWRAGASNEFGHDFTKVGGPVDPAVCKLSEDEIHDLLKKRARFRRVREFRQADGVRDQLRRSGVKINDRSKEWRADGCLADGSRMGPSPRNGAAPDSDDPTKNLGTTNEHGHVYTEVGTPTADGSVLCLSLSEIHRLLRERMLARRARDFERADEIMDRLRRGGVEVDDKSKEWRTDVLNEHGHDYTYVGQPFESVNCALSWENIHCLIRERRQFKLARDFEGAEAIQKNLWSAGVQQDDKRKVWTLNPRMRDCKTIEEAIEMTTKSSDKLTTGRISAFWAVVPRLLDDWAERPVQGELSSFDQLSEMLSLAVGNIESFSPRELSTTTLGLARILKKVGRGDRPGKKFPVGSPHEKLRGILQETDMEQHIFRKIANATMRVLSEFDARCLANLSYAHAIADHSPEIEDGSALLDHLAERSIPLLRTFKSQELSNMLWAYAHLDSRHPDLFREAGDVVVSLDSLQTFAGQALSNLVWSYATLKEQHPKLFMKVEDHVLSLDDWDEFRPQTFSNMLWAYAQADESHHMLFKRVAGHIVSLENLSDFRAQHLSNLPWAYATAREPHPKLFDEIAVAAVQRQEEFTPQGVANYLWAYATNGKVDEHLFSSMAHSVERLLGSFNGQELANVAWAYSVANVAAPLVFNDAFVNACLTKEDEFKVESLSQLHQWQLWQEELRFEVGLPPPLRKKCHEAFVSQGLEHSAMQDDVVAQLSSIGLRPEVEKLTEKGYRLDAFVDANGKKVALEVDGPFHFVGRKLGGRTILKRRQVANLEGIRVASVPYWEWDELGADNEKKLLYLRLLLDLF